MRCENESGKKNYRYFGESGYSDVPRCFPFQSEQSAKLVEKMGNSHAQVGPLSIPMLVKQLGAYHLPEDRNGALETIEQIDIHLADRKTFPEKSQQLRDSEGLFVIIRVTKKMIEGSILSSNIDLF